MFKKKGHKGDGESLYLNVNDNLSWKEVKKYTTGLQVGEVWEQVFRDAHY
jgi:hypothetical protein